MPTSAVWYLALLGAFILERGFELHLSAKNARWAFRKGGHETGQLHYRAMTVLHACFFAACGLELVWRRPHFPGAVGWAALGVTALGQVLRYWSILTLGRRWNTRVIVLPETSPVVAGPYRYIRHPNYLAVCLELAALPAVHGLFFTSLVFSVANALLLRVRIRTEEAALGSHYEVAFAHTPRFVPGARHD
nr:hypothetical protein Hi04_10k_c5202_00023 [uncultured bacterium]